MTPVDHSGDAVTLGRAPDPQVLEDPARLAAVAALVSHGPAGARVQELTTLTARLLQAPFAQVSLLAAAEQVIAAAHGLPLTDAERSSPVQESLCSVTAAHGGPLAVPDTRQHPWVKHLPPVTSGAVAAYLGVALRDADGRVLGSLCVYDAEAREWTTEQVATLTVLAEAVTEELARQLRGERDAAAVVRMQLVAAAADLGSYDYDLRTGELVWDQQMLALHGYDDSTFPGGIEAFNTVVHPEDLVVVSEQMRQAIATVGELKVEYRAVLPDGSVRWVNSRGRVLPDMLGRPARILGAAYDRSPERGLRDELSRLFATMPAGFMRCANDWTITFLNGAAEKILDAPGARFIGGSLWDAFPEMRGTSVESEYRRARETCRPAMVEAYFTPLGAYFEVHVWPDSGGLSFFFHDVSDRRKAHVDLEAVSNRLALLAGAGARLSASLQPAQVLAELADLVVPDLAASLVVSVVADLAGSFRRTGTQEFSAEAGGPPPTAGREGPAVEVAVLHAGAADTGRAGPAVEVAVVHAGAPDAGRDAYDAAPPAAALTVPLRSGMGVLGSLKLTAKPGQRLDELLLTDLAGRTAVALENALVFARQARAATDLQRGLLPREPAGVPGVVVATRYLPALTGSLAGGDFFKTVRVGRRLVAVLGDVMGHGSVSAARAGQLHSVIATLALEGHGPGALLGRLAAGIEQIMDLELATLLVCSYDPATRELCTATAGHPPPLVAPLQGAPFYLDVEAGAPIGVLADTYPEQTCRLEPGGTLVLFSDGLVEQRGESITDGLERLRAAVEELRIPPEAVADHLLRALGRQHGGDDDVALLVMSQS